MVAFVAVPVCALLLPFHLMCLLSAVVSNWPLTEDNLQVGLATSATSKWTTGLVIALLVGGIIVIGAMVYAFMWYRKQRREQEQQVQGPYVNVGSAVAQHQVYVPMESIPPGPSDAPAPSGGYQLGGVVAPAPAMHPTVVVSPRFAHTETDQMARDRALAERLAREEQTRV